MKFSYLWDRFKYFLKKSARPKRKLEIKPRSTFFIDGVAQSHVDADTISTDYLPPSHSTAPPLPNDVEDHAHTPVHPSHSPNITSLNFHVDLVVSPLSCHMHFFSQPSSLYSANPPNDTVFFSSIPDSTLVVNEDQAIDGVGVSQPTCAIIHEE